MCKVSYYLNKVHNLLIFANYAALLNVLIPDRTITNTLTVQFVVLHYQRVAGKELQMLSASTSH